MSAVACAKPTHQKIDEPITLLIEDVTADNDNLLLLLSVLLLLFSFLIILLSNAWSDFDDSACVGCSGTKNLIVKAPIAATVAPICATIRQSPLKKCNNAVPPA